MLFLVLVTKHRSCTDGTWAGNWARSNHPLHCTVAGYMAGPCSHKPIFILLVTFQSHPHQNVEPLLGKNTMQETCVMKGLPGQPEPSPETHHGSDVFHGFSRKRLVSEGYRTGTVFTQALWINPLPPSIQTTQPKWINAL